MRFTTFVSLVTSLVLLSREYTTSPCGWVDSELTLFQLEPESPATNAAPVPSQGGLVEKRVCWYAGCRLAEVVSTSPFKFISLTHFRPADRHWH